MDLLSGVMDANGGDMGTVEDKGEEACKREELGEELKAEENKLGKRCCMEIREACGRRFKIALTCCELIGVVSDNSSNQCKRIGIS